MSWDLVRRAQAGDRESFAELYRDNYDRIFGIALKRTCDWHLAEDVASETFLRAFRRIDSVSDIGQSFGAWLATICHNIVIDHWKCNRTKYEVVGDADVNAAAMFITACADPIDVVVHRDQVAELSDRMGDLTASQQECIQLRFLQERSIAETAASMDKAEPAVKALQGRATRKLAELMVAA